MLNLMGTAIMAIDTMGIAPITPMSVILQATLLNPAMVLLLPAMALLLPGMAIRVWSFQAGDTKFESFLLKNQHTQRKLLKFEFWITGELSKIGHHFSNKVI